MNSMKFNYRNRLGITITEALASIAVAAVGLFAVIAVIPFAARQTEAGLDLDVSVAVGKNAFHDFDVRGLGNAQKWRLSNIGGTENYLPNANYWRGKAIVIDPLYLTRINPTTGNRQITDFPEISIFPYPLYNQDDNNANRIPPGAPVVVGQSVFGIDRLNISALGSDMNFAQAETVFRSINELLYDEQADKLLPPNQQLKRDASGMVDLKRSYSGKISWMAMLVPESSPAAPLQANPHTYRLYVIVFRGRELNFDGPTVAAGEAIYNGQMQSPGPISPNGGAVDLKQVASADLPVGGNSNQLIQDDYLQSGDWILLTDYAQLQADGSTIDSSGMNWRWYQIQRVEPSNLTDQIEELNSTAANENGARVTLVGPDWTGRDIDLTTPNVWDVRAIAMSNVVAVYEKTIRVEYDSIWNE